ncbi:MAG: copper resistance protein CopB [Ponticaulis sp.]|nr:copper resistance protein CopB [Ponticaulis sp.]
MRPVSTLAGFAALSCLIAPVMQAQSDHSHHDMPDTRPWSQADAYWGSEAMAETQGKVLHHHGEMTFWSVSVDRAEIAFADGEEVGVVDGDVWYGGDINKLWFKTEGEYEFDHGEFEELEVQALWSRAISPFFDLQAGVRYDFEPDGKAYGVIGLQGMTPYRFEVDTAAFLSEDGDVTASAEVEYELMLTNRLHLEPRFEIGLSAQDSSELGVAGGFTDAALGVRLGYDVVREFTPYVGVEWQGSLGETRSWVRAAGDDPDATVFVLGFSAWH